MGMLADSPIYAELAEEEAVLLFADGLSAILSDRDLVADRIHPNANGYARLAAELAAFMRAHGLAY
jgi:acyl-CoA thioesterase-1